MDKKQLSIELSKLKGLSKFNVKLEQYQIDSNLASDLLWLAYQNNDTKDKIVADLGCGNGILGIGALLLGAKFVYFLDLDKDALKVCLDNIKGFKNYKLINCDVKDFNIKVDTVVMNPPFGVQNRKADKIFLEKAMENSKKIYSIHKIEGGGFIEKLCSENGFEVLDIIEREFVIKKSYRFHTKEKYGFLVGIWVLKNLSYII